MALIIVSLASLRIAAAVSSTAFPMLRAIGAMAATAASLYELHTAAKEAVRVDIPECNSRIGNGRFGAAPTVTGWGQGRSLRFGGPDFEQAAGMQIERTGPTPQHQRCEISTVAMPSNVPVNCGPIQVSRVLLDRAGANHADVERRATVYRR